ncbi:MAG: T9SS type A sorting domain-containing protein [Bacteroidota bacterium]
MKLNLAVLFLLLLVAKSNGQTITTIAGGGTAGLGDGGLATSASLGVFPGIAFDTAGNIIVATNNQQRVRKINIATGIITTIAGTGISGYSGDGGLATAAKLYYPNHVAVDKRNNIFLAGHPNRIRKIDGVSGIITTIAGNGTAGFAGDGGPATSALINACEAIAFDASGNLFFSDMMNFRIRMIDTNGIISTVAGDGTLGFSGDGGLATAAQIGNVWDIKFSRCGDLFIGDQNSRRVRKIDMSTGIITTVAGDGGPGSGGDGGPALAASFRPWYICFDVADNLYIADSNRIRVINNLGIITTLAGNSNCAFSGDGGPATAAQLCQNAEMILNAAGDMLIADAQNFRVRKIAALTPPSSSPITTSISITVSPNDTAGIGTSVTFTAITTGGTPTSYTWYKNDTIISGASTNTYTYIPVNNDSIRCAVSGNDCSESYVRNSNTIIITVLPELNVEELSSHITISPNPATTQLNIQNIAGCTLIICDLFGRQLINTPIHVTSQIIPIDNLPAAVYLIHITAPTGMRRTQKLIKQ